MSLLYEKQRALVPEIQRKIAGDIGMLDSRLSDFQDYNFIRLTNIYLLASYCYYELDVPIMSDGVFDALCGYLADHFDALEMFGVWHVGSVIVKENLDVGTCIGIEYPEMIQLVGTAHGKLHSH